MSRTAILLAAGSGSRMQGNVQDKVLEPLNGLPIFLHSAQAFLDSKVVDQLTIVYRDEEQRHALTESLQRIDLGTVTVTWALGGKERQDSVFNALRAQAENCQQVFIHDSARPLITSAAIRSIADSLNTHKAAVLAHPVVDTIKRIPKANALQDITLEDLERDRLWAMETPQAFDFQTILKAYQHVKKNALSITDDTAAVATIGIQTTIVPNDSPNIKITTAGDLKFAEFLCA
ncbi:MAG TPA: 2-C-methyl-D-erythritol 4-phosphate cytidylyltransferase [Opitutae bacterium]|nr:2-C-methyl-D-erythritol 4-phosphate cytidylyltransferase [Opitutae bacterium]